MYAFGYSLISKGSVAGYKKSHSAGSSHIILIAVLTSVVRVIHRLVRFAE